MGCATKVPGGKLYYATPSPPTVHAGKTHVECRDGRNIVPRKALVVVTTYKQCDVTEVPNQSRLTANNVEMYKIAVVIKEVRVGEVLDRLQELLSSY